MDITAGDGLQLCFRGFPWLLLSTFPLRTGAESPALCSVVVNRQAGRGALAMLHGIAASIGSVTSGAVGLARAAGNRVLNTPVNITLGEWRGTFMRATALALKRPHTSPETAV